VIRAGQPVNCGRAVDGHGGAAGPRRDGDLSASARSVTGTAGMVGRLEAPDDRPASASHAGGVANNVLHVYPVSSALFLAPGPAATMLR